LIVSPCERQTPQPEFLTENKSHSERLVFSQTRVALSGKIPVTLNKKLALSELISDTQNNKIGLSEQNSVALDDKIALSE